jgi:hypothetical protein
MAILIHISEYVLKGTYLFVFSFNIGYFEIKNKKGHMGYTVSNAL